MNTLICGTLHRASAECLALVGRYRQLLGTIIFSLALGNGAALAQISSQVAGLGSTLPPLLELLDRQNPELQATGYESQAPYERIHPAGALPDPILPIEEVAIPRDDPTRSPSGVGSPRYAFRQTFPLGGTRALAREIAEAGAHQAQA